MPLWLEIVIFLAGWTLLAGAGWALYLKIRSIEQKHDAVLAATQRSVDNADE